MLKTDKHFNEEAIGWVIRLRDASAEEWEAFTAWLEADPAHLEAYERAALADADAGALSPEPARPIPEAAATAPFSPARAPAGGRRMVLGWGIAASLALFAGWFSLAGSGGPYSIETTPGERQTITLEDGTRIELNGGTKITLDEDRPRYASLDRGEALFRVVHDDARPFEVEAGGTMLRDLGTVFNVVRAEGVLDVAVSEGSVLFDPAGERKTLSPGMELTKVAGRPAQIVRIDNDAVGAWRDGRLVYSAAPLSRVAGDLSRNLGLNVVAAPQVGDRAFSGVIMLEGGREEVLARASALVGVELVRSGDRWIMKTGTGAGS
jgi:transmembrane sensor